jgi:crossover junction endodeoxyribonuclease RuvC
MTSNVRILGVDPGTLRLGYGVVDANGPALSYVECGVITAPAQQPRVQRLLTIGRELRDLLHELSPDVVALEEAFFGKNVQATIALGEARGVVLFVARDHGLPVAGYPPAKVKQIVVGHGRAPKPQVAYLIRATLGMKRTPVADAADALAIALCHARVGLPRVTRSPSRPRVVRRPS